MGNYILSPFKKNEHKNKINNHLNIENKINEKRKIILQNDNSIYSNLNDLTNFGNNYYDNKKSKANTNIYYHGYKYNKKKKSKKGKLLFEDAKEGILMNNIKRLSIMIFDKKKEKENNNTINNTDINNNKNIHYIKKYHNNDKFYQFGKKNKEEKKENLIIINNNKDINYEKEETSKSKSKKKKSKNKSKNKNKDKIKKLDKSEKSSQFILLNNYNAFNTLKEINNENIITNSNNVIQNGNEIKFNNNDDNNDDINIDIYNKEKNDIRNEEMIKDDDNIDNDIIPNENVEFEKDINYCINDDKKKEKDKEKNINFKETNDISEDLNIESKLIDSSSIYSYLGDSINNKKEGIGKLVYKNKIGLMAIFDNNKIKINSPIIISDINGNSFQGYVDEDNNLNGYFELKLNFNKIFLKKKYKYKNNFFIEPDSKEKEKDDPINIVINFTNLVNNYLNLSTMKYNYYNIESQIYKNNINNNYGIIKWKNNSKYIGEIKNNTKHGIGIFIWSDGSRYEGEFSQDKIEGWGVIYFFDGKIFQGQILNGVPHGYGEFIWTNNNRYVGNYLNGQKEGFGIYIMNLENLENKNKTKNEIVTYFGFWKNGKQDGYGIIIKNKKINYVKYKEGKKIRQYDYDIFIGKINKVINIKQKKIFFSDIKSLKNIIKSILQF